MILGSTIAAASPPPAPAPDFFSSPLFGAIVGSLITAALSYLLSLHLNRQQKQRDDRAYKRQVEREKEAYIRSLRDAKRERLRTSFKVLLNAADAYQVEAQQMNHIPNPANISLTGVDEVVNEITLEGVGTDVLSTFIELRRAFNSCSALWSMPSEGNWEEVLKHKGEVISKVEELKTAMNTNLEELEQ